MKPAQLAVTLDEMIDETKKGHLHWQVELQSTDEVDDAMKPRISENGLDWIVDECFISFCCKFHGNDYLMITYEHIKRHEDQVRSDNLIFLPPMSIRIFDVGILSPYIIEADAVLLDRFHQLWMLLSDLQKSGDPHVYFKVFDPFE